MAKPVTGSASIELAHPPDELWPYVADTDKLDKSVGLPPATFQRGEAGKDKPDVGEYRWHGVRLARWIENPFEWERPRHYAVMRDYLAGPLARFYGGAELTPSGSGTIIRAFVEFTPRSAVFAPFIWRVLVPRSLERSLRAYRDVDDFLARKAARPFPKLLQLRTPANKKRLDALLKQVAGSGQPAECVQLVRNLIEEAPDEEVAGMRPLQLATQYGVDPGQTLETFLCATVCGLLEMRWEMLCPGCRGVKADAAHLSELQQTAHCEACNLDFDPELDELIEARFYPAASVRQVEVGTYCVSGPSKTPNRLLQALLDPGQTRELRLALEPGSYMLRSPQTRGSLRLTVSSAAHEAGLTCSLENTSIVPEAAELAAGDAVIMAANATSRRLTLTLDRAHAQEAAATPGRLMTFPVFQSLFSAEALAPGIELQVSRVGLLFTDLTGSTALYERLGDARAFRLVTDHFAILRTAIEQAGGALIKTIGDAVMGAFPDGRSAVDAALRIQRSIVELDPRETGVNPRELLKVGVHAGPCFAVTQNERLDYFGTAVNVAARAQHEARGGEVVLTAAAHADAQDLTDGCALEPFTVELKGISQPVPLVRVRVAASH
jgi:adenylate cyclase